jgi:hypothetical protein
MLREREKFGAAHTTLSAGSGSDGQGPGYAIDLGGSRSGHVRAGSVNDGHHASWRLTDSRGEAQNQKIEDILDD